MKLPTTRPLIFHRWSAAVAAVAIAAAAATVITGPAFAQSHDHGAAPHAKLSLNQGHKWTTDDALRSGMGNIRALVEPQVAAAHGGKLSPAQYAALARKVESEISGIVANCKLEPKADAMLHLVIADLGEGIEVMAGKNARLPAAQGLVQVAQALNEYGNHFEHPGFKPIRNLH